MKLALVLVAGCWSSSSPSPQPPPPAKPAPTGYEITMSRTPCFGACPVYSVTLHPDGTVDYLGTQNVITDGAQQRSIDPGTVAELGAMLEHARYFELNEHGRIPKNPTCIKPRPNTTQCDFEDEVVCSDTSSTVFVVAHGGVTKKVTNDHCMESVLDAIETAIDDRSGVGAWVYGVPSP